MSDAHNTDHPTSTSYEAGAQFARSILRGERRFDNTRQEVATAKKYAAMNDDADAFMDGYQDTIDRA